MYLEMNSLLTACCLGFDITLGVVCRHLFSFFVILEVLIFVLVAVNLSLCLSHSLCLNFYVYCPSIRPSVRPSVLSGRIL